MRLTRRVSEPSVFGAGVATIVLHLLDDGFVNNQPGTTVSGHLVGYLLPIAIAVGAVVLFPRLGPGWRAILALVLGVLAVGGAIVTSLPHVASSGPSGSDFSAVLMTLGGLLLLCLGIAMVWRYRLLHSKKRAALAVVITLPVLLYGIAPVLLALYVAHAPREEVDDIDLGTPYEEVRFETEDGLTLAGWFIPSGNGATILAVPGSGDTRAALAEHARLLADHGYGVLMLDLRGNGESEGDPMNFGWFAERDVVAALDYLSSRQDVDPTRIGGLGLSLGAEAILQSAAHDHRLRAVVAEGAGIRTIDEQLLVPGWSKWVVVPNALATMVYAGILSGASPPDPLNELVGLIAPRPIMLISSRVADERELNRIYQREAGSMANLWEVPDAPHTGALATEPALYMTKVINFFDSYVLSNAH